MNDAFKQRGTHDLITRTMQGHKRPDAVNDASVFIHTESCIYALDDDGFCMEIISLQAPGVALPENVTRCQGGQYVACLKVTSHDAHSEAGLVPQPIVGGRALFVGRGTGQKVALLRTAAITRVDHREVRAGKPSWGLAPSSAGGMPGAAPFSGGPLRGADLGSRTHQQLPAVRGVSYV